MKTRRKTALLLSAALMISLCGCGGDSYKKTKEETLYNGYMGLRLTLPADWYELERSDANLTSAQEESRELESLEATPYDGGGTAYPLIHIANGADEANKGYAAIQLYAEDYGRLYPTMDEYIYATELANTGELSGGVTGALADRNIVMLGETRFTKLTMDYTAESSGDAYTCEFYLTKSGELYLCAALRYATDDAGARSEGRRTLESMLAFTEEGIRQQRETKNTYYNTYLGLTFTLPANRYVSDIKSWNLSNSAARTETLDQLETVSYNDGGYYLSLVSLRTGTAETDSGYAELDLYAEGYPQLSTMEQYLDAMAEAFTSMESAGLKRTLLTRDTAQLKGRDYHRLTFSTEQSGRTVTEECYVAKVKELYFIAQISYGDAAAETAAREMLELFELGEEG